MKKTKKTLRKIAGKPTVSLSKEITKTGRGAIANMSSLMARKIKS